MLAQQITIAPITDVVVESAEDLRNTAVFGVSAYSGGAAGSDGAYIVATDMIRVSADVAESWLPVDQPSLLGALVRSDVAMPGAYADLRNYWLANLAADGGNSEQAAQDWLVSKGLLPARAA